MAAVKLIPIDDDVIAASKTSISCLESQIGCAVNRAPAELDGILQHTGELLRSKPRPPAYGCFLAVDESEKQVVGTCGYKDAPTADGSVELAYYTFPSFEGRGYAMLMARELTSRANGYLVVAHTLPERNASCRVLEKAGFKWEGEVIDPEDGRVWRWTTMG